MNVTGLQSHNVHLFGDQLWPFLEQFTENGRYTVYDLFEQIANQDRQCWVIGNFRAVALTRVTNEQFKTCWITHLSGDGLSDWQDAFEEIEAWARSIGCKRIEAVARPGYEKIGKKYGLKKQHVMLTKDLYDG